MRPICLRAHAGLQPPVVPHQVTQLLPSVGRRCSGRLPRTFGFGIEQRSTNATCSHVVRAAPSVEAPPKKESGGWWTKDSAPNMRDVQSIQELVDELAEARDKLVIVEFFAPWCNACRAVYPKLCKLMAQHPDDVLFLKVSFDDNKDMCKTMGVKVLPWFQVYRGAEGRVDAFSCTISKIQRMKDAIERYTAAFCSLEEPPGIEEFPDIKPHVREVQLVSAAPIGDADRPTDLSRINAW